MSLAARRARTNDKPVPEPDDKAGLSFGELEHAGGFVLRIAQLAAFDRFFALYPDIGIKISEFTVLLAVQKNPGVRQGVLADVLRIKWPNMTKLVWSLERRGLITRHIPTNDRRSVALRLSSAGRKQIERVAALMYERDRKALSMLNDDEHRTLVRLLRKVAGWPPEGDAP